MTDVVTNAVTLHVDLVPASKRRLALLIPLLEPVMKGLDPQWAIRPPGLRTGGFARLAELARRECDNHVCAVANFTYGPGPDVLWRHENLSDATHAWISREFGWVPTSFFRQIGACAKHGSLVAVDDVGARPARRLPRRRAARRHALHPARRGREPLLPAVRPAAHARLAERPAAGGRRRSHVLPGFSHMDVFFGRDAPRDVFPRIVAALAG